MLRRSDNITPEDETYSREDLQAFIDTGRPEILGKPDYTVDSTVDADDVRGWLSSHGVTDANMIEKMVSDLDSYL